MGAPARTTASSFHTIAAQPACGPTRTFGYPLQHTHQTFPVRGASTFGRGVAPGAHGFARTPEREPCVADLFQRIRRHGPVVQADGDLARDLQVILAA